jgi:uncharacterized protein YjbJ (UPF0337 family)
MKSSTTNELEGQLHEVTGKIKETVGHATSDPDMEVEGAGEKVAGKIQKKIGEWEKGVRLP